LRPVADPWLPACSRRGCAGRGTEPGTFRFFHQSESADAPRSSFARNLPKRKSIRATPRVQQDRTLPLTLTVTPSALDGCTQAAILGFMPAQLPHRVWRSPPVLPARLEVQLQGHPSRLRTPPLSFSRLTSLTAEGMNMPRKPRKGWWAASTPYTARIPDKPTILSLRLAAAQPHHEDTRFYALGDGHSIPIGPSTSSAVRPWPRPTGGRQTPNIAGLGGKVLTQVVSRYLLPPAQPPSLFLAASLATP